MAGGFSSKWRTMGSNTNSTGDSGTSGGGTSGIGTLDDGVSNISNEGTNNQVRHECTVWLVDNGETYTPSFDWAIDSDFTVVLNGTLNQLPADAGDIDVDVEGSLDGTNYIKLQDLVTWNAGGGAQAETVAMGV